MPYLNGEYLTDDEVTEREMATRAQYQDFSEREPAMASAAARAQSQDRVARPPGIWQGPQEPSQGGPPSGPGPWGTNDSRRDLPTGPWEGRMGPLDRPPDQGPIGLPPWMRDRPRGRLPGNWRPGQQVPGPEVGGRRYTEQEKRAIQAQQGPRQASGTLQPTLQASGRRARDIAREAFAARQQSGPQVRQGGRRGRPASHPGGGRGGFRLGNLLGGMAGGAPLAALGGWMGGRR
jgi:hypothetical protein